jgi:hypothetical protein
MSNRNSVQIERQHSYAICAEIGERLRLELNVSRPLPLSLSKLVERLPELDQHNVPSIAPR